METPAEKPAFFLSFNRGGRQRQAEGAANFNVAFLFRLSSWHN